MKSNRTKDLLIRIAKAAAVPLIAWAIMQVIDMAFAGMGVINNAADVKTLFRNLISSLAFALAIGANLNCGRMDLSLGAQMYAGVIFGGNIALMFHLGGIGVLHGSLVGGLVIGLLETFVAGYISSGYKDAIAFIVLILALIIRPTGIFGKQVHNKV